jgi:serine/threonine-protein kinase
MHPQGRNDDPAPVPSGEAETAVQSVTPFAALLKDRYRIESAIGSGGFAAVYLARDTELHNRPVVIKVLHERQESREWVEKKFRQECEALSRIGHPGIVGVKDQGSLPDGRPFLVMEFINGVTLRSAMKDPGGMDLRRAAALLRQVAQALSVAHDAGVHHRDLKPENIMIRDLGDGQELAVIIDFGIATVLDSEVPPSTATMIAGSRYYMAPEQLEGRPQAASDIYALGVIAFEMVTGSRPFRAGSAVDLFLQQQHGPQQGPCALRPDLPPAAGVVILKALSFDAAGRYARATEFGVAFEGAVIGHAPDGVEPEPRQSRLQTRMLDVGMQAQVPIYEPAELVALIRRTESTGLKAMVETDPDFSITVQDVRSRPFQMEFPRDQADRAQPLELTLSVASPDFEPKEQSKVILVPPDRDSEAYTFLLAPQHLGELRLTLEVRLGAVNIASKIIKTHAEPSERIAAPVGRTLVSIPIEVLVDVGGALPAATPAAQPSLEATGEFRFPDTAAEVLAEAHKLKEQGQVDAALARVKTALEFEPMNREANLLKKDLQEDLRRKAVRGKAAALVAEAERKVSQRSFSEAVLLLESALRMDKTDTIQARLEEVRGEQEKVKRAVQLLGEARRLEHDRTECVGNRGGYSSQAESPEGGPAEDEGLRRDRERKELERKAAEAREREEHERNGPRESIQHKLDRVRPVAGPSSQGSADDTLEVRPMASAPQVRAGPPPPVMCAAPVPPTMERATPFYRRPLILAPLAIVAVMLGVGYFSLRHAAAPPPVVTSAATETAPSSPVIQWRGNLKPGERMAIQGATCSLGSIAAGELPATRIQVDAKSLPRGLQIVEHPSAQNGFTLRLRNAGTARITNFTLVYRSAK